MEFSEEVTGGVLGSRELSIDRRGDSGTRGESAQFPLLVRTELSIDRRLLPRSPTPEVRRESAESGAWSLADQLPWFTGPSGSGEPRFAGALRRISRGVQRRMVGAEEWLEQARGHLESGDSGAAFEAFGQALLARPLDPAPVPELERLAASTGRRAELAELYGRLLDGEPGHPSRDSLARRIDRLRRGGSGEAARGAEALPVARVGGDAVHAIHAAIDSALQGDDVEPTGIDSALEGDAIDQRGIDSAQDGDEAGHVPPRSSGALRGFVDPVPSSGFLWDTDVERTRRDAVGGRPRPSTNGLGSGFRLGDVVAGPEVAGATTLPLPSIEVLSPELGLEADAAESKADEPRAEVEPSIGFELGAMLIGGQWSGDDETPLLLPAARAAVSSGLRRMMAWAVDGAVLGMIPIAILAVGLSPLRTVEGASRAGLQLGSLPHSLVPEALSLAVLFAFVYLTLCWSLGGRTLGGHLAGLQAIDRVSGEPPGVGRAALRALLAIAGTCAFLAGPLWALVDPKGEALHDKLAGTALVNR